MPTILFIAFVLTIVFPSSPLWVPYLAEPVGISENHVWFGVFGVVGVVVASTAFAWWPQRTLRRR